MKLNKNLIIGLFSCSIESYTASMYIFAGPELKSQIFPYLSPDSATFFHYLIIFLGLLCYPLGGRLFGYLGDSMGRKKALTYSSLGLAVSTGLLGLVPLGLSGLFIYIPAILFTALFCLQHFCSGGDYNSAAIFTVEHVEQNNTPKLIHYSGLACVVSVLGLILGQLIGGSGYWRLGCLTGFIGAFVAFYIRQKSEETPSFLQKVKQENINKKYTNTSFLFEKIIVFMFAGFLCTVYYYVFVFLTAHLVALTDYSLSHINIFYFIIYALSLWVGALIAAKHNLLKIIQVFSLILFLLFIQFCLVLSQMDNNNFIQISVLIGLLVMFMGFIIGPQHALYLKLFPVQQRCQAIVTNFTLGAAIIGGITPFVCKLINNLSGNLGLTALWPAIWTGALLITIFIYNRSPLNFPQCSPSNDLSVNN